MRPAIYYPAVDLRYKLPIPQGAAAIEYSNLRRIWPKLEFPPFIDRFQTLLDLLNHAFQTHYGPKPVVTMCTTGPGFGKTRTLVEWGVQVFQHPCVVAAFLQAKKLVDPKENEDVGVQIVDAWKTDKQETLLKARALFLVRLHRTLRESTVVTTVARNILNALKPADSGRITPQQVEEGMLVTGLAPF